MDGKTIFILKYKHWHPLFRHTGKSPRLQFKGWRTRWGREVWHLSSGMSWCLSCPAATALHATGHWLKIGHHYPLLTGDGRPGPSAHGWCAEPSGWCSPWPPRGWLGPSCKADGRGQLPWRLKEEPPRLHHLLSPTQGTTLPFASQLPQPLTSGCAWARSPASSTWCSPGWPTGCHRPLACASPATPPPPGCCPRGSPGESSTVRWGSCYLHSLSLSFLLWPWAFSSHAKTRQWDFSSQSYTYSTAWHSTLPCSHVTATG